MWMIEHFLPVFPNYGVNDYGVCVCLCVCVFVCLSAVNSSIFFILAYYLGTAEGIDSNPTQVEMTEVDQAKSKTDSSNTSTKLESHVVDVPFSESKFSHFLSTRYAINYETEFRQLPLAQQDNLRQEFNKNPSHSMSTATSTYAVGYVKKTYAVGSFQEFLQVEFNIDYDTEFHRLKTEQQELAQQQFKNRLNKGAEI
jgi:hypothetical protein